MAVERITAWRTTAGHSYDTKREAYHEEMVHLVRTRGETNKVGFDLANFDSTIADQRALVSGLKDLKEGLAGKQDKKIIEELDRLLLSADTWLKEAETLRADMNQVE